jgi:hypothetical protein
MSREAIVVGAFTWSRIQRLYDGDAVTHWQRCESEVCSARKKCSPNFFTNNPTTKTLPLSCAASIIRRFAPHPSLPLRATPSGVRRRAAMRTATLPDQPCIEVNYGRYISARCLNSRGIDVNTANQAR